MKFLLDIPLIMSLASWVWSVDDDENDAPFSPEICVGSLPLMNGDCWQRAIAKGLGLAIIGGACINKMPMIVNMLDSQSAAGLSKTALYGDVLLVAHSALYGILQAHPFTAYGENIALLVQSLVLVGLLWKFSADPPISTNEQTMIMVGSVIYAMAIYSFLPTDWHFLLISSSWPVSLYSRGNQIWTTFQVQHTGAQSGITLGLNTVGSLARIFTTFQEVGFNLVLISAYSISVLTNGTMLAQLIFYRTNTLKFLESLKDKKKKD